MGQPLDQQSLQSVLLTVEEANRMNPQLNHASGGNDGAMIIDSS
jgi:hypothetical protein